MRRARSASPDDHPKIERMTFRPVTPARWSDLEDLFESRGGPKYCWCMAWRATSERHDMSRSQRKLALKSRVKNGIPIGILGYLDGVPIAWCSIAPRPTYRKLGGLEKPDENPDKVWSLVCFFVKRELRGKGVMTQLLDAAVAQAKKKGAKIVEAYPVNEDSPSYRFMGFVSSFDMAGFKTVGRAGSRRHVMRKAI
jgi:GNAT superfamily N-acetyltransferase